jgi:hypothetical protein
VKKLVYYDDSLTTLERTTAFEYFESQSLTHDSEARGSVLCPVLRCRHPILGSFNLLLTTRGAAYVYLQHEFDLSSFLLIFFSKITLADRKMGILIEYLFFPHSHQILDN